MPTHNIVPHISWHGLQHVCSFFLFELMVVQAWSRKIVQLLSLFNLPVRILFPSISSNNPRGHKTELLFSREISPNPTAFELLQRKFSIRTFFCIPQFCFRSICIHVDHIPRIHGQEMKLVRQDQICCINFFHMGAIFCFFPTILISSTYTDKNNTCFR